MVDLKCIDRAALAIENARRTAQGLPKLGALAEVHPYDADLLRQQASAALQAGREGFI